MASLKLESRKSAGGLEARGAYRCGIRGRRAALWGGSLVASAGRLTLVAGLGFPL